MTTLVAALAAIERGEPFAMRKAVDAIGVALDVLRERDDDAETSLAETTAQR